MAIDFTIEELIKCLTPMEDGTQCGIDEVLLLLADFIENEEVYSLVNKYVDDYYEWFDNDIEYIRTLEKRVEDLEGRLKYGKRRDKKE